jgi:hypothetical protein
MTTLYPTKTRLKLLTAIGNGRVGITNGLTLWRTDGAFNRRCDAQAREVAAAGWARLGADGCTYELTDAGRSVLDGAR